MAYRLDHDLLKSSATAKASPPLVALAFSIATASGCFVDPDARSAAL